ncbi:hypothetical protein, partial [Xanthomonas perforans]|uniref:hypothetical protein n=1 Tax=Xanthomonas perforans TaxID=442694 RepID=UPI0019D0BE4F
MTISGYALPDTSPLRTRLLQDESGAIHSTIGHACNFLLPPGLRKAVPRSARIGRLASRMPIRLANSTRAGELVGAASGAAAVMVDRHPGS